MALISTSPLNPPSLPPMLEGVELYAIQCESVCSPTPSGELSLFRSCTILVSFAKADAERTALLPLRHALAFGQTSLEVLDGADWLHKLSQRLSDRLKAADDAMVVAAVYAGSGGDSDAEAVQAVADALRQCFGASLAALLVVAVTSSGRFDLVKGVSGFVVGANGTNAETARSVFLYLAMFSAPKTLNGIDLFFLEPVFGTAASPTVLADAVWLRDGEGRLVLTSSLDAHTVRSTSHVVAIPLVDGPWSWSELRRFSEAVRGQTAEIACKIYFAADGALAPGLLTSRVSMVPILCGTQ